MYLVHKIHHLLNKSKKWILFNNRDQRRGIKKESHVIVGESQWGCLFSLVLNRGRTPNVDGLSQWIVASFSVFLPMIDTITWILLKFRSEVIVI